MADNTVLIDAENIEKIFNNLILQDSKLKKVKQSLSESISKIDIEVSNILHKAEFETDKNVIEGYKIYQRIRELYRERRQYKRKLYKVAKLLDILPKNRSRQDIINTYIKEVECVKNYSKSF